MKMTNRILVQRTADQVWNALLFFFHNTENYKRWHPDHIACYWKKGKDFSPGSVLVAEEYIHGKKHKIQFQIQRFDGLNRSIAYTVLFPFSLICTGGYFNVVSMGNEAEFIAALTFRGGSFLQAFFKRQIGGLTLHLQQEGENMKRFVEEAGR